MKHSRITLIIISVLLLSALLLTGCGKEKGKDKESSPDYAEPPVETGAESMGGEETKLTKTEGGGAVGLTYMTEATAYISSGTIELLVGNPSRSVDNIAVKVYVKGEVVAETGILEPGNKVTSLKLTEAGLKTFVKPNTSYDGMFEIELYNADTNEKSMINTEIPIVIVAVN